MNDETARQNGSRAGDLRLYRKAQRATRLTMLGQVAGQIISLVVLAELYHLVDPIEFGILGMFMPITLLIRSFGSLGMDIATVQKRDLTKEQSSTLFWYQIVTGIVLTLILAALAPVLAYWFEAERLLPVGLALSGTAFLYNSYSQHKSLAEKKLLFGRLTIVRVAALAISGILAVTAAWHGFGVWALVLQQYIELIVLNVGFWAVEPWRPGKMAGFHEVRELLHFSGFYTLSGLFFAIGQNLDKIVLGVLLGGSPEGHTWIGYYTQAYNQMIRPVYLLTSPITAAMLPALSQAKDLDETFTRLTAAFYRMVGIMLAPCSVGMFLVGEHLMPVLGGDQWKESGELLGVLGLMILAQSWINISGTLMSAAGRTDILALGALANLLALAMATQISFMLAGDDPEALTLSLAHAVMVATVLICGPYLAFCFHFAGLSVLRVMVPITPAIMASLAMGAVVYGVGEIERLFPEALILVSQVIVGVIVYLIFARTEVLWLWRQLRGINPEEEEVHTAIE